ncbi:MAG: TolC family protein, partial [Myxococcales bacterium]|nr:TolC family protein [Myxococcales bacterium]
MMLALSLAFAGPLELHHVLEGLEGRHPKMEAARAKQDVADAALLARRGAFDPTLHGKASAYGGKYVRDHVDVGVRTQTILGPAVTLGYTRGTGDIPEYAGDTATGPLGELVGRLEVPLLKDLGLGKDRAELQVARIGRTTAEAALGDTVRVLRRDAGAKYWDWVAAGMDLRVAEEQLRLAERRAAALERQVQEGTKAPMDQLDNERVLEERRAKMASAREKLEVKALALSLYVRGDDGAPVVPAAEALPETWPQVAALPEDQHVEDAPDARPDLAALRAQVDAAIVKQRASGNALLPDLRVTGAAIQPLDTGLKHELVAGVSVKAPLAFREGLGERRMADAYVAALQAEQRLAEDTVRAEVEAALVSRRRAEERAEAARRGAERAEDVLALERRRYALGGSDLFQLLQREDALAKARSLAVEA